MEKLQHQTDREEAVAEVRAVLWSNSKFRVTEYGELELTTIRIIIIIQGLPGNSNSSIYLQEKTRDKSSLNKVGSCVYSEKGGGRQANK